MSLVGTHSLDTQKDGKDQGAIIYPKFTLYVTYTHAHTQPKTILTAIQGLSGFAAGHPKYLERMLWKCMEQHFDSSVLFLTPN